MKIEYTVEEVVRYSRTIEVPESIGTDNKAIGEWIEANYENDWTANGHPIDDFDSVDARELAGWNRVETEAES